jgi:glycosyltransferase involved in cell wall biosynthesis
MKICIFGAKNIRYHSRIRRQAEALLAAGHEVVVVSVREGSEPALEEAGFRHYRVTKRGGPRGYGRVISENYELPKRPGPLARALSAAEQALIHLAPVRYLSFVIFYLRCLAIARRERADLYQAHDYATLVPAYLASRLFRPAGGKRARFAYDAVEYILDPKSPARSKKLLGMEGLFARRADAIFAVSNSIAESLVKNYRVSNPRVVRNSLSAHAPCRNNKLRSLCGLPDTVPREPPLAIYVGAMMPNRGLEQLISALCFMPKVHLAIVGHVFQDTDRQLAELAQKLEVDNRAHLFPPVPNREIADFISGADIGVFSLQKTRMNHYYALPNKVFEFLAARLPMVVSDFPEMRAFVMGNGIGQVIRDETDPRSIAEAVLNLLSDEQTLQEICSRLEAAAAANCWERDSAIYVAEIESKLGAKP